MPKTYKANMRFEAEVRFIAEAVWGMESGACQPAHYPSDPVVRELDGIARLRDMTHLVMVTTSTKLEKVKEDVKKLNAAEALERRDAPAVCKWLITKNQLDAQHLDTARKNNVTTLTLEQFKKRFFDGWSYISKRETASFGSARNPSDNSVTISDNAYVPLPMAVVERVQVAKGRHEEREIPIDLMGLCNLLTKGNVVVLTAPFGAGKSLTTRELFRTLSSQYRAQYSSLVPVCLNLREHWGQEHFDEMLERHARSIGFAPKEDLVVAWRAGLGYLLLDGFDEVASQTIVRKDDINFMKDSRRMALTGVRDFLTKRPSEIGVFICGRDHYFDNDREMAHALGISANQYKHIKLGEFTEDGANAFLKKHGVETPLPDWLPRKPLILSYLIQNDLLNDILQIDAEEGYGYAWDQFIGKITQREADLERAVMDAHTLRNVMERLAYFVRTLSAGNGPITGTDLAATYNLETGQSAGEGVLAQLQRLPGLTQRDLQAGSRSFVDPDMMAALQGGALARIIREQFDMAGGAPLSAITENAVSVASYILKRDGANSSTAFATVQRLLKDLKNAANSQHAADCFTVAVAMAREEDQALDCHGLVLESANFGKLDFEESEIKNVLFSDCIIGDVVVGPSIVNSGVRFRNCMIGRLYGVANKAGLPPTVFEGSCEIAEFDQINTNNAVMQSDLAPPVKALLTVLRKLYRQAGAGRKKAALTRGITAKEVADYIPSILDQMERKGFIRVFNHVVHPVRKNANRVERILNAPSLSEDELIQAVKEL